MRSLLPDPLKQEGSSLQVTFGKRRKFLFSELLHFLFVCLLSLRLNLKKTEESSLLVNTDRAHSVVKSNDHMGGSSLLVENEVENLYAVFEEWRSSVHVH